MSDEKNIDKKEVSENDKKLNMATLMVAAFCFIPLIFLFAKGVETRGIIYASLTMGVVLLFGFFFCRIVSVIVQKYCEKNEITLATKKIQSMSRYDPGLKPTMIIKGSRFLNMIVGAVSMWWLTKEFDYNYMLIAIVAGFIFFTAINGRDVTIDPDALEAEREEYKKRRKERREQRYD